MKKIDSLILRSFVGPFILTFIITMFIFVMQFLWLYVDNLIGFGLETTIIARLIFYFSASIVPLALPLAILLSSIMTYGNLAEFNELTTMKSSGVSLIRIMRPLTLAVIVLCFMAFLFSNYVMPVASLKFRTLIYDISKQKPTMNIKEGIFYKEIDGYVIRAESKDENNKVLNNVMIYDHTSGYGNDKLLLARRAEMLSSGKDSSGEPRFLVMNLFDGRQYQDMKPKGNEKKASDEYLRTNFKEFTKVFDLSQFKMKRTDEEDFKEHYKMLNLKQLDDRIDTLLRWNQDRYADLKENLKPYFIFERDEFKSFGEIKIETANKKADRLAILNSETANLFLAQLPEKEKKNTVVRALSAARNVKNYIHTNRRQTENNFSQIIKYKIEWHKKFTLSIACLVLFFIGAPFGAIIRRGGFGLPFLFAIIFFVIMHVTSIIGEKLAEQEVLTPFVGVWLATFILTPMGIFFTIKARNDSGLFNLDWYYKSLERIFNKLFNSNSNS